jgi:hypothetical protein
LSRMFARFPIAGHRRTSSRPRRAHSGPTAGRRPKPCATYRGFSWCFVRRSGSISVAMGPGRMHLL